MTYTIYKIVNPDDKRQNFVGRTNKDLVSNVKGRNHVLHVAKYYSMEGHTSALCNAMRAAGNCHKWILEILHVYPGVDKNVACQLQDMYSFMHESTLNSTRPYSGVDKNLSKSEYMELYRTRPEYLESVKRNMKAKKDYYDKLWETDPELMRSYSKTYYDYHKEYNKLVRDFRRDSKLADCVRDLMGYNDGVAGERLGNFVE